MKSTFEIIKSNYERDKKQNTPYIIGINGIDCAGKTTLAKDLSGQLEQSGIKNKIFHIDDFNDPKVEKETYRAFASGNWNENDFDRYCESIIDFQKAREAVEKAAVKNEIVIVEGIFIFHPKLKITFNYRIYLEVDASVAPALEQACATHTPALVFIETPSNPWLKSVDIAQAADCAHKAGGLLAVDSTAATPVLQRPLEHGADIVMHSATKAINGHSDVLAGVLATAAPAAKIWTDIKADRHDAGAVIGPFEAWLLLRGMRTLPLRVAQMCRSTQKIAEYLSTHPKVADVYYPGLSSHPGHDIATRQMQGGFGCLFSFLVKGGAPEALAVVGKLKLFHRATSLGGVESLVEHRHTIEPHTGIPPSLIRVSVGIEDADDLIADLEQALG